MLAEGIAGSSLRALAKAAGTSDRMLLYYFTDKQEIVAATLRCVVDRFAVIIEGAPMPPAPPDAAAARLTRVMLAPALRPYLRLWLEIVAEAARGDRLCRAIGEEIGRKFLAWCADQVACEPDEKPREAARLLAAAQGAMALSNVGLGYLYHGGTR